METDEEEKLSDEWESMDEDEDWKDWWDKATEEEKTEQSELEIVMKKLMQGKGKLQYHTKKDLPTKEEAMENFRLGKIDQAYEEKWE